MEPILISIATWLGSKIADKGFDYIYNNIDKETLDRKFYSAVKAASEKLQNKYPEVLGNSVSYFFTKENVLNELFKLLFKDSKIEEGIIASHFDHTLPHRFIFDFIVELRLECFKDPLLSQYLSNKELYILIQGIGSNLNNLVENSNLTLREVQELKELLSSKLNVSFNYSNFLDNYYQNALRNLSQVNFIGLGVDIAIKRKRKNLQDVFVKPYFSIPNQKLVNNIVDSDMLHFDDDQNVISYDEIFKHSSNIIVLGDPGSGKSVLIKSIICDIIEENGQEKKIFPIRVELRKYLSYKKINGGNFLNYLASSLESEYAIHNITIEILTEIFSKQISYIFFDGLDEIFKIEDKLDIKNDIENFHSNFSNIMSITTSRIIGYEEARLDDNTFCELTILKFSDEQIREYVYNWYEKEEENEEIRTKEIDGFFSKIHEIDQELVSNPLLLSLIVILYRNILKLPESKLEIYQSCTKTLVDKWDASKDLEIHIDSSVYKNKEKILADLAYWQYQQLSSEELVVSYEKAKQTVNQSINEKIDVDDIEGEKLAESFMEYAQKRSIYFDNNFTHKTFLEYYTAYWIYSNIEKKHKIIERNAILTKYISNSFWHIVLELLLIMIDKDQADSEIMDGLLNEQSKEDHALPFLVSTLSSFRNLGKKTIESIISRAIVTITKNAKDKDFSDRIKYQESIFFQIYDSLKSQYFADQTLRKIILDYFISQEYEGNEYLEMVYQLYLELQIFDRERNQWALDRKDLFTKYKKSSKNIYFLSIILRIDRKSHLDQIVRFIENFGPESVFDTIITKFESIKFGNYFEHFFNDQFMSKNLGDLAKNLAVLEEKGLTKARLYNYAKSERHYIRREISIAINNHITNNELDKDVLKILLAFLVNSENFRHLTFNKKPNEYVKKILNLPNTEERFKFIQNI